MTNGQIQFTIIANVQWCSSSVDLSGGCLPIFEYITGIDFSAHVYIHINVYYEYVLAYIYIFI